MRLAGKTIHFFSMIPLYPEALALKLRDGTDALIEGLDAAVLSDVVDPVRIPACRDHRFRIDVTEVSDLA